MVVNAEARGTADLRSLFGRGTRFFECGRNLFAILAFIALCVPGCIGEARADVRCALSAAAAFEGFRRVSMFCMVRTGVCRVVFRI